MTLAADEAATPGGSNRAEAPTADRWIREAMTVVEAAGLAMGPRKVHRLVRRYQSEVAPNGIEFFDFITNAIAIDVDRRRDLQGDPTVARVVTYADPTGEHAVHNVMKGTKTCSDC